MDSPFRRTRPRSNRPLPRLSGFGPPAPVRPPGCGGSTACGPGRRVWRGALRVPSQAVPRSLREPAGNTAPAFDDEEEPQETRDQPCLSTRRPRALLSPSDLLSCPVGGGCPHLSPHPGLEWLWRTVGGGESSCSRRTLWPPAGRVGPGGWLHAPRLHLPEPGVRKPWRGGWRDTEPNAPPSGAAAILGPKLQGESRRPRSQEEKELQGKERRGRRASSQDWGAGRGGEAPAPPATPPGTQSPLTGAVPASYPLAREDALHSGGDRGSVLGRALGVRAQDGGASSASPGPGQTHTEPGAR